MKRDKTPLPLYYRIKQQLRERIQDGDLRPGDRLAPESQLAKGYEVSTITVKRALLDLVQEGLLFRIPGKGTFVAQPKMERDLSRLTSFTEEMLHRGLRPHSRLIQKLVIPARPGVAKALELSPGDEVIMIERVRLADGQPLMLEKTFLPHDLFPGLLHEDLEKRSLYYLMTQKFGVSLVKAREWLEPIIINSDESPKLGVKTGTPGLLLELVAYNDRSRPVEYTKAIVRGDKSRYYIEMAGLHETHLS